MRFSVVLIWGLVFASSGCSRQKTAPPVIATPPLPWIVGAAVTETGSTKVRFYQVVLSPWSLSSTNDISALATTEPRNCAEKIKSFEMRGAAIVPRLSSDQVIEEEFGLYYITCRHAAGSWEYRQLSVQSVQPLRRKKAPGGQKEQLAS